MECSVGDSVIVHFRNNDMRATLGTKEICFDFPFLGEICFPVPCGCRLCVRFSTGSGMLAAFTPNYIKVASGSTLTFGFQEAPHTVKTVSTTMGASGIFVNNGAGDTDPFFPVPQQRVVTITGMAGAEIDYQCGIHVAAMTGKIEIV
jgi:plastocyanin